MSWISDLLGDVSGVTPCIRIADEKTAPMFARRQHVRDNWNPTGTYTPDQLERIVNAAFDMMHRTGVNVLDVAIAAPQLDAARQELMAARFAIFDVQGRQQKYRDAIREARANGITQITATDVKRWVLSAMEVTQAAVFVATKVQCETPAWFSILVVALNFFMAAADIIVGIAGVVLDAAKAAIDVFDWLSKENLLKYALVAAVAYGGYRYMRSKQ